MKLVVIESPYAGDVERNLRYLRACLADCLARGEAPYASHALYTQPGVLDDRVPDERAKGMRAGFAWGAHAELVVVYEDLGVTPGMLAGIERAEKRGQRVERRRLSGWETPRALVSCMRCREPATEALVLMFRRTDGSTVADYQAYTAIWQTCREHQAKVREDLMTIRDQLGKDIQADWRIDRIMPGLGGPRALVSCTVCSESATAALVLMFRRADSPAMVDYQAYTAIWPACDGHEAHVCGDLIAVRDRSAAKMKIPADWRIDRFAFVRHGVATPPRFDDLPPLAPVIDDDPSDPNFDSDPDDGGD